MNVRRPSKRVLVVALGVFACALLMALCPELLHALRLRLVGKATIADRIAEHGADARQRLGLPFQTAGVEYPPARLWLLGLKQERRLELYAGDAEGGAPRFVQAFPVLAASGELGPKLRRGDGQVPEGVYPIESLNPNSRFHLSLRLGYPNSFDRRMAAEDGRTDLGSDIMIHGNSVSIGCLAIGDRAAEDLFVLVSDVGLDNTSVIIAPVDFRQRDLPPDYTAPRAWIPTLHAAIVDSMAVLPLPD